MSFLLVIILLVLLMMLVVLRIFTNIWWKTYKILFKFTKQGLIVLLSFSGSLARIAKVSDRTKCILLNNEPWSASLFLLI